MALPSPKELKKLAKACRAAGIKVYKSAEVELTFTDEEPAQATRKGSKAAPLKDTASSADFETDTLTQEQLLFYSVANDLPDESDNA